MQETVQAMEGTSVTVLCAATIVHGRREHRPHESFYLSGFPSGRRTLTVHRWKQRTALRGTSLPEAMAGEKVMAYICV